MWLVNIADEDHVTRVGLLLLDSVLRHLFVRNSAGTVRRGQFGTDCLNGVWVTISGKERYVDVAITAPDGNGLN